MILGIFFCIYRRVYWSVYWFSKKKPKRNGCVWGVEPRKPPLKVPQSKGVLKGKALNVVL